MEYDISDIQGDALLVGNHLQNSLSRTNRAAEESDTALSRGFEAKEKLEVAIQDVASYVQKSGESLAAGRSLATNAGKAHDIITTATLGQDLTEAANYAARSSEYSMSASQNRDKAIYHGNQAIFSLNAAANGLAAVIAHSGKSIKVAEDGLRFLGCSKDVLNEKITAGYDTDDNVKGMSQKLEAANEKSATYLQSLRTAKGQFTEAPPSTPREDEYFDNRHDVGDIQFLTERIITGVDRLRKNSHKRVGTFNQALELVCTKVTERDIQDLSRLLNSLNEALGMLTTASEEQKDLPGLIQGALKDRDAFRKSL